MGPDCTYPTAEEGCLKNKVPSKARSPAKQKPLSASVQSFRAEESISTASRGWQRVPSQLLPGLPGVLHRLRAAP